jgi:hypothetical protein
VIHVPFGGFTKDEMDLVIARALRAVIAAVDARIQEPETTLEALRASLRARHGQAADSL